MTFKAEIEYEVPGFNERVKAFKEAAALSRNKKTISVGESSALQSFSLADIFTGCSTWNLRGPAFNPSIAIRFPSANPQSVVINILAEAEARRATPDAEKNAAFKQALIAKANTL
jgi:hypothetical protein